MSLFPYKCGSSSQPLHPVNRLCTLRPRYDRKFPSMSTIFSDSHCFCGAMAAVKIARLQDLESATTSVKTAAIIHASRKNGWLSRNLKKFHEKKAALSTSKKPLHLLPNSRFYQFSLFPKKRMVETDISTFHIISFNSVPPDPGITTPEKPHLESSHLQQGAVEGDLSSVFAGA